MFIDPRSNYVEPGEPGKVGRPAAALTVETRWSHDPNLTGVDPVNKF